MTGLQGRRRQFELARAAEAERKLEEERLLGDLGREPSATERLVIEILSTQAIRWRRMRQAGRLEQAEMCERLLLRALHKLGVRSGQARPQLSGPAALAAWLAAGDPADAAQTAVQTAVQTAAASPPSEKAADKSCAGGPFPPPRGAVSAESSR